MTVLGAAGGIGQPLSLLMKLNPRVTELALYDIKGGPGKEAFGIAVDNIGLLELQVSLQISVISTQRARSLDMSRLRLVSEMLSRELKLS